MTDVWNDPNATDAQVQAQYAKDMGMNPNWFAGTDAASEPIYDEHQSETNEQQRAFALTVASQGLTPRERVEDLLDDADRIQLYLASGEKPESAGHQPL